MNKSLQTGFTLMELMVAVAVIGVTVSLASSSVGSLFQSNQMTSYSQDLLTTLNLAKSEAITRNRSVTTCQRAPGPVPTCSNGANWNNGWIVFVDVNNDGVTIVRPLADPNANIIRVHGPLKSNFNLAGNNNIINNVTFNRIGFPRVPGGGGLQIGTFLICGPRGYDPYSRKVVVSASGRIRIMAPGDPDNYNSVGNTTCPVV